ncbi:hypothetical protein EVG20_g9618 [Dentipellis fragilis]|uniref:Uncharacterized protein n=1 Tax=Dentipellis fragilis TaxID=205917 RepID=A0A4Y9XYC8_9AGAM|nr:hypothetical protein EVG20_g9618 [Dentipellis fragilis]
MNSGSREQGAGSRYPLALPDAAHATRLASCPSHSVPRAPRTPPRTRLAILIPARSTTHSLSSDPLPPPSVLLASHSQREPAPLPTPPPDTHMSGRPAGPVLDIRIRPFASARTCFRVVGGPLGSRNGIKYSTGFSPTRSRLHVDAAAARTVRQDYDDDDDDKRLNSAELSAGGSKLEIHHTIHGHHLESNSKLDA